MIIRSKAPLRLGLAGGGTDVNPYSELFGGAVLNATINLYAYSSLIPRDDNIISINIINKSENLKFESAKEIPVNNNAKIVAGVYNRIIRMYNLNPLAFDITIFVDAPAGSGLGSSSTLLVSVLGAFKKWLNLPLSDYEIAGLAWEIERIDLGMEGGKQDQYAATFGGVNYMEFNSDNKVVVNPLRINSEYLNELSHNLLLYFTGTSRLSSDIIAEQVKNVKNKSEPQIEAMHKLKEQSLLMKEALLLGEFDKMGKILDFGWEHKKLMAGGITNNLIDSIYKDAKDNGASGGKISGAGGGGFMVFYCPGISRHKVASALSKYEGRVEPFEFTNKGLMIWTT